MKYFLKLTFLLLLSVSLTATAQTEDTITIDTAFIDKEPQYVAVPKTYCYRVTFTDKKNNVYNLKRPEEFLSPKALERRKRHKIKVDKHDLPVSPVYLDYLRNQGLKVRNASKWNNSAVVETADTTIALALKDVSFVCDVRKVWESKDFIQTAQMPDRRVLINNRTDTLTHYYGAAKRQVTMIGADSLHKAGLTGQGVTIAVLDGGFCNVDAIKGLSMVTILGTRDFVNPSRSVYDDWEDHGTMVLSCIAANTPYSLIGTAPNAAFYLLTSEDGRSEYLIEEDNWCAAIEYADSLGVDMVTSSLGYYGFDDKTMSHKYYEQDGLTAVCSRAASLAASRGIIVLNSAGNSGDEAWKKIGFPADARDILTVGAVNKNGINTVFSSLGNTEDGRIKPDVMAMGEQTWLYNLQGKLTTANGTSFSCPLMCGGVACLVQAFPEKRPVEIIRAVQLSGNNADHPNNIYGYGIPNLWKAYQILKEE